MNLDELRTVQSKERSKDSLQHLRESFYEDVADYIADLREQRDRAAERADNPFDDSEVNRLTDEIHTAEEVVEAIYERRVGKVVKRASLAAAGMPADEEGLTNEEQELFNELVERIETNKEEVLDVLAGESDRTADSESAAGTDPAGSPASSTPEPGDPPTPEESGTADVSAADVMGGDSGTESTPSEADAGATPDADADDGRPAAEAAAIADDHAPTGEAPEASAGEQSEPDSPSAEAPDDSPSESDAERSDPLAGLDERTTVRLTDDVGEIFGVDERTYELEREDVVTLPEANAEPLVERGAAEKLE